MIRRETINMRDTLGYLVAQVCRNHRGLANELLANIGLYTGQEMILTYLAANQDVSQIQLVNTMGVQPATMTKVLQRLQKRGYVERVKDQRDSRIKKINLTEKGKNIQQSISDVWEDLEIKTFKFFTNEEKVIFRRLLLQIMENFENE